MWLMCFAPLVYNPHDSSFFLSEPLEIIKATEPDHTHLIGSVTSLTTLLREQKFDTQYFDSESLPIIYLGAF